jgi:DNA-binding response OmpR family regulator
MLPTPRDFRSVRATVVEGNSHLRSDMRLALLEKGIREPTTHRTVDSFIEQAGREMLDLVICDTDTFEGDFVPAMQRIRKAVVGGNPFVVVIATVGESSIGAVQAALAGGVDDLMGKPAPAKTVVDRIDFLVKARKPFIATRHYVGPSRAAVPDAAEPGEADGALIQVPNTLRAKVVEKAGDAALRRAVARAAAGIKAKIAEHPLAGIERLIRRAVARQGGDEAEARRHFDHLRALSLEMSGHYRAGGQGHIADLAQALARLAERIAERRPPEPSRVDLDLLNQLGGVVRGAMAVEAGAQTTIQEIAAMVDRYAGGTAARRQTYH